jgi:hypothetical protein
MPVRRLPENPNLEYLKYQAKDLLKDHAAHSAAAAQRIREFHPDWRESSDAEIFAAKFRLSDAQLAIAREYGFLSWPRLKRRIEKPKPGDEVKLPHHERIEDPVFRRGVELIDAGDAEGLRSYLKDHPKLARQHVHFEGTNYFHNPGFVEFVAGNPIRRPALPKNIVDVARVILDEGVDQPALDETLALVATGSVPRECGQQIPLIDLLCDYGADIDAAIRIAAVLYELDAVVALLRRGARMTLAVAAAQGRIEDVRKMLSTASAEQRHLAFALAAQYRYVEIVRLLLDAGEDPDRFNPVGGHSHATALHQAAGNGMLEVVKLLVERGARTDIKDILFGGTPLGWAKHEHRKEVEAYLREKGATDSW